MFTMTELETAALLLFQPTKEALITEKLDIGARNHQIIFNISGKNVVGFVVNGCRYEVYKRTNRKEMNSYESHHSLVEEMASFHKRHIKHNRDFEKVFQSLRQVYGHCKNDQDVRDNLPDLMCSFVGKAQFANLPRTREVGFSLKENPQQYEQYMDAVTLMSIQSVYLLIGNPGD